MKNIKFFISKLLRRKGNGISILVPFHSADKNDQRSKNWNWLNQYWKKCLPGAEIIIGEDKEAELNSLPFSKSVAVNNAASKAHGDIFVIIDADAYISADSIITCAKEIRLAKKKGFKLWFVPYRKLFRLTEEASEKLLNSNPKSQFYLNSTLQDYEYLNKTAFKGTPSSQIGHWYGAMIQLMSKEAFEIVGGWDIRFRGWGGEDHAAMTAMDTLYSPHKTLAGQILHIWHPTVVAEGKNDTKGKHRLWYNQKQESNNDSLSGRYYWSDRNPNKMRKLVSEWKEQLSNKTEKFVEKVDDILSH